ncbi:MAG: archaemetzincin [Vulcanimicrobiota bacterium]
MRKWILAGILLLVIIASIVTVHGDRYYSPLPPEYVKEKNKKAKTEPFIYDDRDFMRMRKPSPGDWLDRFDEFGQSFEDYKAIKPTRPTIKRRYIVLLPIGDFSAEQEKLLQSAAAYCEIYYCCPVRLEKPLRNLDKKFSRNRSLGPHNWTQYRTGYFLDSFLKPSLPEDALCYLGVTMSDLYPGDSWNFVFGQASVKERVGVYSLFRYAPGVFGGPETENPDAVILRRSMKVMVHEIGHMFSLYHCIYYHCRMNGGNSLQEMDSSPLHMCPICLQKLQWNLGFDMRKRYERLRDFYEKQGMNDEAAWIQKRLNRK